MDAAASSRISGRIAGRPRGAFACLLAAVAALGFAGCGGGGDGGDGKQGEAGGAEKREPKGIAAARRAAAPAHDCLTKAGYRVTAGSPRLDDRNGPDYQFVLQRRGEGAFVAFYSTLARADRYVSAIRKNARKFGGTAVERRGAVTIVWVRLPEDRRARVRACLDV